MEIDYKYKMVKSWDDLETLISYCKKTGYCSSDFETSGCNAMYPGGYPTILGVSFQPGSAWIIPLGHKESIFKDEFEEVLIYFGKKVIQNPNIVKIGQNIKYEMNWWYKYGITMIGRVFDTMLAKYMLDEERPHGLKEMVDRFIPEFSRYDLPGVPSSKAPREKIIEFWTKVPLKTLSKYCALDADLTFRLWVFFERRLIDNNFYPLYRNMLMMASRVLAEAEWRGMEIDVNYLKTLVGIYKDKIEDCEEKLRNNPIIKKYEKNRLRDIRKLMIESLKTEIENLKETGGSERVIKTRETKLSSLIAGDYTTNKEKELLSPLNFGSPNQMIDLLFSSNYGFEFEVVKYTEDKKTKKSTERPSTDEEVLKALEPKDKSGFIKTLLEYRGLTKLNSTYVVGMWDRVTSKNKIHGSFLIHGTVTGRLSSRDPNLQNIPRDTTASDIKKMFIAPKGKLILQLDYSQAELRVLAFSAKEKTMMEWFNSGRDIHTAVACKKFNGDYDEVETILKDEKHPDYITWKKRRKKAKTTNFGIVYEQSARKLAETLSNEGVPTTVEESEQFLQEWFEDFPMVKKYINRQHRNAKRDGYVYNLFGRKRRLPNVDSDNKGKQNEALRQSVNAPIQGAASDFALFSSIIIREQIKLGNLPSTLEQVGTVHDSLIFYIYPQDIHKVVPILYNICKNPETHEWFNFEFKGMVMKVDFEVGLNWGEIHKYNEQENYLKYIN